MDAESEKSSLLTVIRLLNEEQASVISSNKNESSQSQQALSSWRVADSKTHAGRSVGHHINLNNKHVLYLEIEGDDEAEMSSGDGNNQTLVQNKANFQVSK